MKFNLKWGLLTILGACLLLIFTLQILERRFIALPELYRLEADADNKAVDQVRNVIAMRITFLEKLAWELAVWDDAYHFAGAQPGSSVFNQFISANFPDGEELAEQYQISGVFFLNPGMQPFYHNYFERVVDDPRGNLDINQGQVVNTLTRRYGAETKDGWLVGSGVAQTPKGPILYSTAEIVKSDYSGPPRGLMIFWRWFDAQLMEDIANTTRTDIEFLDINSSDVKVDFGPQELESRVHSRDVSRDHSQQLQWVIEDVTGAPALLVRQQASPRGFNDRWVSTEVLLGLAAASFVLVLIGLFVSQRIVRPVTKAGALMRKVRENSDFSRRLKVTHADELGEMFSQFNSLLMYIENLENELRTKNQQLEQLAEKDHLTGVSNRRYLEKKLEYCFERSRKLREPISVLMLDVDFFKAFNDNYGHLRGDGVLVQVANTLQNNIHRATDYLARYGGEEFCLILTNTGVEDARCIGERLCLAVEAQKIQHLYSSCSEFVTLSAGVATADPRDKVVPLDLVRAADEALYKAKEQGRNQVFVGGQAPR